MPGNGRLDRGIEAEGHREDGIYIPGPVTNYGEFGRVENPLLRAMLSRQVSAGTRIKALKVRQARSSGGIDAIRLSGRC